jgi:glycosyltransferase involved in cell wall biosynthesis
VKEIGAAIESAGHSVSTYLYHSDSIVQSPLFLLRRVLRILFSSKIEDQIFAKWVSNQDSIQIHNAFPGLTFSNMKAIQKSGKPIIRVIHNYRKSCLSGNHILEGKPCFKCTMNSQAAGVFLGCYNNSRSKSLFFMSHNRVLNKFEDDVVDAYVAVSNVVSKYLASIGINPNRIEVIPNSVPRSKSINSDANEILLLARLEAEKGIIKAINLWRRHPNLPNLNIVGGGSLEEYVKSETTGITNIKFHGYLKDSALESITGRCKVALFLNTWDEPFGRTMAEALTRGQALVAYNRGLASEFITNGKNGFLVTDDSEIVNSIEKSLLIPLEILQSNNNSIWFQKFSPVVAESAWRSFYAKMSTTQDNI